MASLQEMLEYAKAIQDRQLGAQIGRQLGAGISQGIVDAPEQDRKNFEQAMKLYELKQRMDFLNSVAGGGVEDKSEGNKVNSLVETFAKKNSRSNPYIDAVMKSPTIKPNRENFGSMTLDEQGNIKLTAKDKDQKGRLLYRKETGDYYLPTDKKSPVDPNKYPGYQIDNWGDSDQRDNDRMTRMQGNLISTFNNDMAVRKARVAIDSGSQIEDLAMSDNPISHASIPTYMARFSGEVGALSEADKAPFGGGKAILTRLKKIASDAATGKLTEENRKYVLDMVSLVKKVHTRNIAKTAKNFSKQYSKAGYGNSDEIFGMLMPDYKEEAGTDSPGGTITGQTKAGRRFSIIEK